VANAVREILQLSREDHGSDKRDDFLSRVEDLKGPEGAQA
jgi:hypothetical protein